MGSSMFPISDIMQKVREARQNRNMAPTIEIEGCADSIADQRQWSVAPGGMYIASAATAPVLPGGYYAPGLDQQGNAVMLTNPINTDELIAPPPGGVLEILTSEIDSFWQKADLFKQHKYLHRRGILLYGPAGSGKSCLIQLLLQQVLSHNGIAIDASVNPEIMSRVLKQIRIIQPTTPILLIVEDLDALIDHYDESTLLAILDGDDLVDHVVTVATTNYPEKLDARLVNRPRRFDRVEKIDYPTREFRKLYLCKKLPTLTEPEQEKWLDDTDKMSFAALAELIIYTHCLQKPYDEAIERLKQLQKNKPNSGEFGTKLGFQE